MHRSDFDYHLPQALIAQTPPAERAASRLLQLDGDSGALRHGNFRDFPDLIAPNDLLVVNDTRVIAARLFATKDTGGRVELLIERVLGANVALAQVRASKALVTGRWITLDTATDVIAGSDDSARDPIGNQQNLICATGSTTRADAVRVEATTDNACTPIRIFVGARHEDLYELFFPEPVLEVLDRVGHVPLPPYIRRPDVLADRERYQTLFARQPGAVAAPTAGLHFDAATLQALDAKGIERATVTLHVGAGTFAPIRVGDLDAHRMHAEWCEVSNATVAAVQRCRQRAGRVIAVGTTVVRALETAASSGELQVFRGETSLFIRSGFEFQVVDAMLTNFHVPQSTLLMLVCAFAGRDAVLNAYRAAVEEKYRFFSYGDAMFMKRRAENHS